MSLQTTLRGTGVALITPFTGDEKIDWNALEKTIHHVIDGGVNYVVSLGTTGETPTLSSEEKLELMHFTFEKVQQRVPVVIGIGDYCTKDVIKRLEQCPLEKATAVLSVAPYYSKPSQEGIFQHYKAIAAASPKPIILYNVPGRTGRNMSAETTLRLAQVPNIAAMKEASGDMGQVMQILKDKPADFLVVSGDDALVLPQIACGMEGVISVAANAFPKAFTSMVNACLTGDFAKAKKLNDSLIEGYDLLFAENNPAGVKAAMSILGLIENNFRLPVTPLSEGYYKKLEKYIQGL